VFKKNLLKSYLTIRKDKIKILILFDNKNVQDKNLILNEIGYKSKKCWITPNLWE